MHGEQPDWSQTVNPRKLKQNILTLIVMRKGIHAVFLGILILN